MTQSAPDRTRALLKLGLYSRIVCFVLANMVSNGMKEKDKRSSIVFGAQHSTGVLYALLNPLLQWDGSHFMNIAIRGYDSVLSHAFFPELPLAARFFAAPILWLNLWEADIVVALCGLVFVQVSFLLASIGLYKFTSCYFEDEQIGYRTALFFIFTSANIFMSAFYTESPFAMVVFWGLHFMYSEDRLMLATILFALGGALRSNGTLSTIFVLFYGWRKLVIQRRKLLNDSSSIQESSETAVSPVVPVNFNWFHIVLSCMVICLPYVLYSWWSKNMYCEFGIGMNEAGIDTISGERIIPQYWCSSMPIYAFIQYRFWGVNYLEYWAWEHTHYFLLMAPSLNIALNGIIPFTKQGWASLLKNKWRIVFDEEIEKLAPFYVQMVVLTFFTLFVANVQILTRILTSCPLYFWSLEKMTRVKSRYTKVVMAVYLSYFAIGPLIFANGWNWT